MTLRFFTLVGIADEGNIFFNWQEADTKIIIKTDTELKRQEIRWWLLPWERRSRETQRPCEAVLKTRWKKKHKKGETLAQNNSCRWERMPRLQIAQRAKNKLIKHSILIESLHGGDLSCIPSTRSCVCDSRCCFHHERRSRMLLNSCDCHETLRTIGDGGRACTLHHVTYCRH